MYIRDNATQFTSTPTNPHCAYTLHFHPTSFSTHPPLHTTHPPPSISTHATHPYRTRTKSPTTTNYTFIFTVPFNVRHDNLRSTRFAPCSHQLLVQTFLSFHRSSFSNNAPRIAMKQAVNNLSPHQKAKLIPGIQRSPCKFFSFLAARGEHKYKNSPDKHGHAHEASANKQCNSRQDVLVAQGQADCTRHARTKALRLRTPKDRALAIAKKNFVFHVHVTLPPRLQFFHAPKRLYFTRFVICTVLVIVLTCHVNLIAHHSSQ